MYAAITALTAADRARTEAHLLRLSPADRSLRFAAGLVTDHTVRRYADRLRFEHDLVLGLVSKLGLVIGMAHGCVFDVRGQRHVEAAFSVDAAWRSHGHGARLMEALLLRTRASGGGIVVGSCAARNLPMRRVFERAQMALSREEDGFAARREVAA